MPGSHALLSPSAAHRWMHCTASPRLEAEAPDKDTTFAQEGTLAHAYCAAKLKSFLNLPIFEELNEIERFKDQYHTGEMDEYTDTYFTIVIEKFNAARMITRDAQLKVETRLDFSKSIPEAFGTADAIIIADGCLEIIDFKYGKGVRVSAIENPQMMIYALGAYEAYSFEYNINRVKMTIVQPRIDNLSEYELSMPELIRWATFKLEPKAREAFDGNSKQTPGAWCQFCKVKNSCKKLARMCIDAYDDATDSQKLLGPAEIAKNILPLLDIIKNWVSSVEESALLQALSGITFEGYKVVEGRSNRKITDTQKVSEILEQNGYDESDFLKPQELRTITDLEKLCGKKKFTSICSDYIDKPKGKPTLVRDSDTRPVFNTAVDDFQNIDL